MQIAGMRAEVLCAGPAPGLVSGVLQVNVRVPESVPSGLQPIQITVGAATSQPGVVLAIDGAQAAPGTGPEIDARFQQLRRERTPAVLIEKCRPPGYSTIGWRASLAGSGRESMVSVVSVNAVSHGQPADSGTKAYDGHAIAVAKDRLRVVDDVLKASRSEQP